MKKSKLNPTRPAARTAGSQQRMVSRRREYLDIAYELKCHGQQIIDWVNGKNDNPPMVMYIENTVQNFQRLQRKDAC